MLTPQERDYALDLVRSSRELFRDALSGVSEAQWRFRTSGWSIGDIAEHLVISEAGILAVIRNALLQPAEPERRAEVAGKEGFVMKVVSDRARGKVEAPPNMTPQSRWATAAEALAEFETVRARTLEFIETTQEDLRSHFAAHFALKLLDGFQWLILIAAHTLRHVSQMAELKTAPGYPEG